MRAHDGSRGASVRRKSQGRGRLLRRKRLAMTVSFICHRERSAAIFRFAPFGHALKVGQFREPKPCSGFSKRWSVPSSYVFAGPGSLEALRVLVHRPRLSETDKLIWRNDTHFQPLTACDVPDRFPLRIPLALAAGDALTAEIRLRACYPKSAASTGDPSFRRIQVRS